MKKKTSIAIMLVLGLNINGSYAFVKHQTPKQVNPILLRMASSAKEMFDAITARDLKRTHRHYEYLRKEMDVLNQIRLEQQGFNLLNEFQSGTLSLENSWFGLITLELKEADDLPALANAVNQFSGQLILLTSYQQACERKVAWMDYLGRDMVLLNKNYSDDLSDLIGTRKMELQKTWSDLRTLLNRNRKNKRLVSRMNLLITDIVRSKNSEDLVRLSEKELEIADKIKRVLVIE